VARLVRFLEAAARLAGRIDEPLARLRRARSPLTIQDAAVRRDKAPNLSGLKSRPATGSLRPVAPEAVEGGNEFAEALQETGPYGTQRVRRLQRE
jgi:hypothetical protein